MQDRLPRASCYARPVQWPCVYAAATEFTLAHSNNVGEIFGLKDGSHDDRIGAAANCDFLPLYLIVGQSGSPAHLVGDHNLAFELLRHILETCGDVHGVAQSRERNVFAVTDVTMITSPPLILIELMKLS